MWGELKSSQSRVGTDCEGRAISKSSCCAGEQKSGTVATGGCGIKAENCFLRLEIRKCVFDSVVQ